MRRRDADRETERRTVFKNTTGEHGITFLLLLAVLLPAISAFGILYRQRLPVPYQDDYSTILDFAANYDQLPTLKKKLLYLVAAQSNEYKLGFEHSIVASEIDLTHHLNFAFLTALGDLFLLPLGYLLWQIYRVNEGDLNRRLLGFLPISLLFFSLMYWENLNWTTTGLQNIPIVFFSLLAIYWLDRARLLSACLMAVLAAFTSANGFLLGPVGLLILLTRRAYARSLFWCVSFAAPLAAYLYHYAPAVRATHRTFYGSRPLFFFAFLGAGAVPFRWPAVLAGILMLGIVGLAVRCRFDRINPASFYFTLWVLATGLLVAWVRGAGGLWIASRYSIYSILLLIFCYTFLAQYLPSRLPTFNRRRYYVTCAVLALGLCFLAQVHAYTKLGARRRMVLSGIEHYRANPDVNSPMIDPNLEKGDPDEKGHEQAALTNAIQRNVYKLPAKEEIR